MPKRIRIKTVGTKTRHVRRFSKTVGGVKLTVTVVLSLLLLFVLAGYHQSWQARHGGEGPFVEVLLGDTYVGRIVEDRLGDGEAGAARLKSAMASLSARPVLQEQVLVITSSGDKQTLEGALALDDQTLLVLNSQGKYEIHTADGRVIGDVVRLCVLQDG